MSNICGDCKHGNDDNPNYGEPPCIHCSEYDYDSQYEPKGSVEGEKKSDKTFDIFESCPNPLDIDSEIGDDPDPDDKEDK